MKKGDTFIYLGYKPKHITRNVGDHRIYEFVQPNSLYEIIIVDDLGIDYSGIDQGKKSFLFKKIKGDYDIKKYIGEFDEFEKDFLNVMAAKLGLASSLVPGP